MTPAPPSNLELQVLSVLWRNGPSTARSVREALPDGKKRAYTTVLSVLQVMEKKGLATHESEGTTHVYRPAVTRRQVLGPLVRNLVSNVFGGNPSAVVQFLLRDTDVSEEELGEIRRVIEEYEDNEGAVGDESEKRSGNKRGAK